MDGNGRFPNLALMKIAGYYAKLGNVVEWYHPFAGQYDEVHISKVFSFTPDIDYPINARFEFRGGTGYAIKTVDGKETFDQTMDHPLPYEIEHSMPLYSMYPDLVFTDTAYGFLSRGCPRGCSFCHVAAKEGQRSRKTADLTEFWCGQKHIKLLDPNLLACPEAEDLLGQLADSKARVDFTQGLDIRLMTDRKAELLGKIKVDMIHFAWDRIEDGEIIKPKFTEFRALSEVRQRNLVVYVLVGDRERRVLPEDLERIYWLRDNGYTPDVRVYNKNQLPAGHELRRLQRWVNNRYIFWKVKRWEDYDG